MSDKYEVISTPKKGTVYDISIWDSIDKYEDYDKLLETLQKITADDELLLVVSTPGGRCDIGYMLIDRLLAVPVKIDVIVPYPTYSMGAIMALCGASLDILPGAFLMFHDYSTGNRSTKGNEIYKSTEAYKEVFAYRFNKLCQPFLSPQECEDVLDGKDLYIKWNDKSLPARIKRHFSRSEKVEPTKIDCRPDMLKTAKKLLRGKNK